MPLGSEGGREGHPLDRLTAPSSQDAGPMVGNCYGVSTHMGVYGSLSLLLLLHCDCGVMLCNICGPEAHPRYEFYKFGR